MTAMIENETATATAESVPQRRTSVIPLAVLLTSTAVFWLIGLGRNGWANAFYTAAVQAGTKSWKAALFGSSDAGNSITVDKPPASLWPMELSARLFGLNSWTLLVPQVLLGVAAVALLYATVRRGFGPTAGLAAGGLLALTPVATLMFRYNNPDALLVLLMVAAGWAVLRAVDDGRTRWLVTVGAVLGLGFLAKQLQVMLIAPAVAGTYLVAGPQPLARRLRQLLAAAVAMVVAGGWWVALVSLTPADDRPYVGGSTDNSFLNLTFRYNGLARLTGHRPAGQSEPTHPGGWTHSHPGVARLFTGESAGQIAWLLAAALILAVAGLFWYRRAPRTDARRAQYLLWGGWLLIGGAVLSAMSGTYHDYYTVALAPAVAALVAVGGVDGWQRRGDRAVRVLLGVTVAGTAVWSWVLLSRTPEFVPALRWVVMVVGIAAGAGIALSSATSRNRRLLAVGVGVAMLAGPLAYCVQTVANTHRGGIVNAGPRLPDPPATPANGPGEAMWAGMQSTDVSHTVTGMLASDPAAYTWAAAIVGANQAAAYQLATGLPVMPVGGFIGQDPSPTLQRFQDEVAGHRIHYFIERPRPQGDEPGHFGGKDFQDTEAGHITDWVKHTFTPHNVDGVTLYDLSSR